MRSDQLLHWWVGSDAPRGKRLRLWLLFGRPGLLNWSAQIHGCLSESGYQECTLMLMSWWFYNNLCSQHPILIHAPKSSHRCMSPTRSPTRIESCPICGHSKLRKALAVSIRGPARGPGKPSPERVCREHGGGTRSRATGDSFAPVSQGWEENYPAKSITTSHGSSGPQSRHNKGVPSPCLAFWMSYTPQ